MAKKNLKSIERRIQRLKRQLVDIGDIRPGTLSVQYRNPTERKRPFNQISYTHKGKSRSEYVRAENLKMVRNEIKAYTAFKSVLDEIINLSIEASRIRCNIRTP